MLPVFADRFGRTVLGGDVALHWNIKSDERLFEVWCDGLVEASEVHKMLEVLNGSGALGYRKLFDGTLGEMSMGPMDALNIGVRIRSLHLEGGAIGPLAVVAPADRYPMCARVLGILASARRPMRLFADVQKARAWLNSPAVRAYGGGDAISGSLPKG